MKLIIDAMGGDYAPGEIVQGALQAARDFAVEIVLVGRGEEILGSMKERGIETLPVGVEIAHADEVVDMHDDPSKVMHQRKNSSMLVGLKMLADGQGDAMISAGSTGALLTAATLMVKRVKGIRRAALGPVLPTDNGGTVLLDCGANAECQPEYLLQFGIMGAIYAKNELGKENPKVGLLNIGAEDTKGTALQLEAYRLLRQAHEAGRLNFYGNVEARDVFDGVVDVVVADGFSGNILLKSIEGTAAFLTGLLKQGFTSSLRTKLGYVLSKPALRVLKTKLDYNETGGTMLLGISKPVIKAHGSSKARAIYSAVRQAKSIVENQVAEGIRDEVARLRAAEE